MDRSFKLTGGNLELLLIFVGDLLVAIVFPVVLAIGQMVVGMIAFISLHVFGYAIKRPTATVLIVGSGVFGGLFTLALLTAIVLNTFYFEPSIKWITKQISDSSGVEISFTSVEGNLLTGKLRVTGLDAIRQDESKTKFDVSAQDIDLDVDLLSLVFGSASLSTLSVSNLNAEVWALPQVDVAATANPSSEGTLKSAKSFSVDALDFSNLLFTMHKSNAPPLELQIRRLESTPFRSNFAVFDTFFRSNIDGSLNGNNFLVSTKRSESGRHTKWQLNDFPAELVGQYIDKAPFGWFEEGTVDIVVEDQWDEGETSEIDMDWRFILKDVRVVTPTETSFMRRAVGAPISRYINSRDEDVDLHFRLVMSEEQFLTKSSLNTAGLWDATLDGMSRTVAEVSENSADEIKEGIGGILDGAKGYLNRKRKKDTEAPTPP